MTDKPPKKILVKTRESQIIGFRLPIELAISVKEEAARRGLPLNHLFKDIWSIYKSERKGLEKNASKS